MSLNDGGPVATEKSVHVLRTRLSFMSSQLMAHTPPPPLLVSRPFHLLRASPRRSIGPAAPPENSHEKAPPGERRGH